MKIVIQRVLSASCNVEGEHISHIGLGLLVFCGVTATDTERDVMLAAKKITEMRIFRNDAGKLSRSVMDVGGEIMLISNFTLCADCAHARRPEFVSAAPAAKAREYYDMLASLMNEKVPVVCGVFGGDMRIAAENFGPVTIPLDTATL